MSAGTKDRAVDAKLQTAEVWIKFHDVKQKQASQKILVSLSRNNATFAQRIAWEIRRVERNASASLVVRRLAGRNRPTPGRYQIALRAEQPLDPRTTFEVWLRLTDTTGKVHSSTRTRVARWPKGKKEAVFRVVVKPPRES